MSSEPPSISSIFAIPAGMDSWLAWTATSMVASMLNEESRVVVESFFEENELLMEVVFLLNHPFFVVFVSSHI